MAKQNLSERINVSTGLIGGTVSGGDDGYNYPLAPKIISFNVPPHDNDGVTSVQKWLPALSPAYHSVASSNDAAEVATIESGLTALNLFSKTYPFSRNLDAIINGEVQYGLIANSLSFSADTADSVLGIPEPLVETADFIGTASSNPGNISYGIINIVKKNADKTISKESLWAATPGGGFINGAGNHRKGVFQMVNGITGIYRHGFTNSSSSEGLGVGVILDNGEPAVYSVFSSDAQGSTFSPSNNLKSDASYLYLHVGGTTPDPKYLTIDLSDGSSVQTVGAPAGWAAATPVTLPAATFVNTTITSDGYSYIPGTNVINVVPTSFVGNTTPTDVTLKAGATTLATVNVTFDENNTEFFGGLTVPAIAVPAATELTLELSTQNAISEALALGFGLVSGTYETPVVDNDASGNDTSGWDVGVNGSYLNVQLASA